MAPTSIVPVVQGRWRQAGAPGRAHGLAVALRRFLLWPVRALRSRREFAGLAAMSDRELRDVGLTRQDLRNATALSRDECPTVFLAAVAADRAGARWSRARRRAEEAGSPPTRQRQGR